MTRSVPRSIAMTRVDHRFLPTETMATTAAIATIATTAAIDTTATIATIAIIATIATTPAAGRPINARPRLGG